MGITRDLQRKRIKRNLVFNSVGVIMTPTGSDGKRYKMQMMPLKYLQGWLFPVDSKRVNPEIKDKLITYQKECFDVLHHYWQNKSTQDNNKTEDNSTAACFSELHIFLELTRGRIRTSTKGHPYNTVSMSAALVLQYLYHLPEAEELQVNANEMGRVLKIDNRCVCRVLNKIGSWSLLTKTSEPGKEITLRLNRKSIEQALEHSKNNLLSNQQNFGFLEVA